MSAKKKKRPKKSLREPVPFTIKELRNAKLFTDTLEECVGTGDIDSYKEVLAAYLGTKKIPLEKIEAMALEGKAWGRWFESIAAH